MIFKKFFSIISLRIEFIKKFKVSQYAFAMCSYRDKKAEPTEFIQLDGFTIDYMPEPDSGGVLGFFICWNWLISVILDLFNQGGKFFFTAIKEGDELKFATDDENERHLWVQVILEFCCCIIIMVFS